MIPFFLLSKVTVGAVCVYPNQVANCIEGLKKIKAPDIPVASGIVIIIIILICTLWYMLIILNRSSRLM